MTYSYLLEVFLFENKIKTISKKTQFPRVDIQYCKSTLNFNFNWKKYLENRRKLIQDFNIKVSAHN